MLQTPTPSPCLKNKKESTKRLKDKGSMAKKLGNLHVASAALPLRPYGSLPIDALLPRCVEQCHHCHLCCTARGNQVFEESH
ncbi:hypothetical protein [Comamonas kerstersii]|uniref:hypothetical protein n=1 Tax=Comamonas kerstersii TaxID=225992 RepID=UPI003A8FA66B